MDEATAVTPDGGGSHDEELACVELVELVTHYLEGALPAAERRRFESHLERCPYCLEYVEQIRALGDVLGGLLEEMLGAERRAALLTAFRGRRAG